KTCVAGDAAKQLVDDFQFLHRRSIAPFAHISLPGSVAKGVLDVLPEERGIGEAVEEFPYPVIIQRVRDAMTHRAVEILGIRVEKLPSDRCAMIGDQRW